METLITLQLPGSVQISQLSDKKVETSHKRALFSEMGDTLGRWVDREAKARGIKQGDITVVIILRGGMLLFPAFYHQLPSAKFAFVACKREGATRRVVYSEVPRSDSCRLVVYLDPFVATAKTMLYVIRHVRQMCPATVVEFACCVVSSGKGAEMLSEQNITLVGFDFRQGITDLGWLIPDFGSLDAGDLACGTGNQS